MSSETNDNETWYLYIDYSYGFIKPSRKWVCFDSIFAVANDTIRRAVICFDANEAKVNLSYKINNQVIIILDSLLLWKFEYEIYNSAECGNFCFS